MNSPRFLILLAFLLPFFHLAISSSKTSSDDRTRAHRSRVFQLLRLRTEKSNSNNYALSSDNALDLSLPADRVAKSREKWQKEIDALQSKISSGQAIEKPIVFVGSSSIRQWDLKRSFPKLPALNCGFGGSEIFDSVVFANELIFLQKPKAIVLYAGDNDIGNGKSPDEVFEDYLRFVSKVRSELPCVPLFFISIKPSIKRWELYPKMAEANRLIAEHCRCHDNLYFIDIAPATLDTSGKPNSAFFAEDGLHLSQAGYDAWSRVVLDGLQLGNLD